MFSLEIKMSADEEAQRAFIYPHIWSCLAKGTMLGGNGMKRKACIIPQGMGGILHDKDQLPWSQDRTIVRGL